MKQFMTGMILPLILMVSACGTTEPLPSDGRLTGVWVHETTGTDTIDFDAHARSDKNAFELKRKPGSPKAGPYWYEVKGDSIQVHWMLSSAFAPDPYAFKLSADGRSFRIGAFVPFVEGQTIHTFKKIK
jgi:lipoprotein